MFQGSIYNVGNELKPVEGTWYISILGSNQFVVQLTDIQYNRIHVKNYAFEYIGSIQLEDSGFNILIKGKGELIHNGYVYNGEFEGVETIRECTLSQVTSNGQRIPLFYGEVKLLMMYAGILIDSTGISEGIFDNNELVNGYVFDSAGYWTRNVGDVRGYERMYTDNKYRELFRRNHGIILHYPTTQSIAMNQFTPNLAKSTYPASSSNLAKSEIQLMPNLAKPGNQPTPNLAKSTYPALSSNLTTQKRAW